MKINVFPVSIHDHPLPDISGPTDEYGHDYREKPFKKVPEDPAT